MSTPSEEVLEPLFPPQELAVERAVQLKRCPILGAMGSGKTRVILEAYRRSHDFMADKEPTVILCGVNAIPTWYTQIPQWLGVPRELIGIAHGTPMKRQRIWLHRRRYRFIITTYLSFVNDAKKGLIPKDLNAFMDEYHKVMINRTKTWETLCSWTLHSEYLFPCTGTWAKKGPQNMFPVLHMCDPKLFKGYWKFVKTWCFVIDTEFGQEIGGARNYDNFKREIWGRKCAYMPKKETDKYLPEKLPRVFIPIEPSPFQRKQIDKLEEAMYLELSDGSIQLNPYKMSRILRERQLLVCPKIIDPTWEYGNGVEALAEKLDELDSPRPVVFTDFAAGIPFIKEYLEKKFPDRQVWTLRGGIKPEALADTVRAFNTSEDDIMVCSQQFAESFEFPRSDTCLVLGYNWSPDVCNQAEDRLRRAVSESRYVRAFYFQYLGTVDGDILQILYTKGANIAKITPDKVLYSIRHRRK